VLCTCVQRNFVNIDRFGIGSVPDANPVLGANVVAAVPDLGSVCSGL